MASDPTKRRRHAEAQQRYRDKRRARRSPEEVAAVTEKRRKADADHNELCLTIPSHISRRRCGDTVLSKFVAKYGHPQFMEYYFPLADAGAVVDDPDAVHVFRSHLPAECVWARHCRRRHTDSCHETQDPGDYESDGDNDTDDDTESPVARKRVSCATHPQPASHASRPERAMAPTKRAANVKPKVEFKPVVNPCATSVPVKIRAVSSIPARPIKGAPASPVKKVPLYADMDDNNNIFLQRFERRASHANSHAVSVVSKLSTLEDEEPMPAAPVAVSPTVSHTISSESSLSATSVVPSQFSSVSTGICRISLPAPPRIPLASPFAAAFASAPATADIPFPSASAPLPLTSAGEALDVSSGNMLFNRKTRVLYDSLKLAMRERKRGEPMEVVAAAQVEHWINGQR
ncbi:hypothetical protein C8R45DRAFT_941105 [Mycena sanguinolenta]|nr:hypothetical protein C8R45DRAFT_941105 [Mycena sanguinolenta]